MSGPRDWDCPYASCGAKTGEPCVKIIGRTGRRMDRTDFHGPRRHKAEHEEAGPQALDVVYLEGLKYRVVSVEPLKLRRGNSHTLFGGITREELSYDPVPGMWRAKAAVSA